MKGMNEREVRLRLGGSGADFQLATHPLAGVVEGKPQTTEEDRIHYDTPDLALHKKGVACFLAQKGTQWQQQIGPGFSGTKGCNKRVSQPIDEGRLDREKLKGGAVKGCLGRVKPKEIEELFALNHTQTRWGLKYPDESRIRLTIEQGSLKMGRSKTRFCDLVLEQKSGDQARFYQTLLTLLHDLQPALEGLSPLERGFAKRDPDTIPVEFCQTDLPLPDDSAEEAFVRINTSLLKRMRAGQTGVVHGGPRVRLGGLTELVRSVGLLREVFGLYHFLLPGDIRVELDGELAWLEEEIVAVFGWERFLAGTLAPFMAQFPDYGALIALGEAAGEQLEKGYRRLNKLLESFRFARLTLGLSHWLECRGWRPMMDLPQKRHMAQPARELAREALSRHHHQLRKRGGKPAKGKEVVWGSLVSDAALLGAATELFSGLFSGKGRDAFITTLEELRVRLDALEEVAAGEARFADILPDKEEAVVHLIKGWIGARRERRTRDCVEAWKGFGSHKSYWL
ncbi:MAG: CHAD domain-containing protein [Magnetococcales bacterium]|nr:CHAD domain-containing protein [Magnetococcales bacterium]